MKRQKGVRRIEALVLLAVTAFALFSLIITEYAVRRWDARSTDPTRGAGRTTTTTTTATSMFHYLRPSWWTVEAFLNLCADFDGSEGDLADNAELQTLTPIFRSGLTFAEAEEALRAYHRIVHKRRRKEHRQAYVSSRRRGVASIQTPASTPVGPSYTCIPWQPLLPSTSSSSSMGGSASPSRIVVLTTATGPYKDIYAGNNDTTRPIEQAAYEAARLASLADRQRYCDRHGYTCVTSTETVEGRKAGWYRIPAILSLFGQGTYEWVFYLDLDAVILDHSVKLEEFLDPRFDLIAGEDQNGLNNGVFFLRNSTWSRLLYAEAWTLTREKRSYYWAEQAALEAIFARHRGAANHLKMMPHTVFNAYLPEDETELPPAFAGAFIVHFAGRADKWSLVQEYVARKEEHALALSSSSSSSPAAAAAAAEHEQQLIGEGGKEERDRRPSKGGRSRLPPP